MQHSAGKSRGNRGRPHCKEPFTTSPGEGDWGPTGPRLSGEGRWIPTRECVHNLPRLRKKSTNSVLTSRTGASVPTDAVRYGEQAASPSCLLSDCAPSKIPVSHRDEIGGCVGGHKGMCALSGGVPEREMKGCKMNTPGDPLVSERGLAHPLPAPQEGLPCSGSPINEWMCSGGGATMGRADTSERVGHPPSSPPVVYHGRKLTNLRVKVDHPTLKERDFRMVHPAPGVTSSVPQIRARSVDARPE